MIGRLNHVAIVVPDLAAAAEVYRTTLGGTVTEPVPLPDHGVTTVFVELPNTKIELLHPLGEDSPVQNFLDNNPSGGMHHVCYEVTDIDAALHRAAEAVGRPEETTLLFEMLASAYRMGAEGPDRGELPVDEGDAVRISLGRWPSGASNSFGRIATKSTSNSVRRSRCSAVWSSPKAT